MHKWLKGRLMPFYAPDGGADGGQAGGEGDGNGGGEPDYKALYEQEKAAREKGDTERAKLKASFDQTAHEVAELKKAQKAKMSEEEKRESENAEREQRYKDLQNEVNEMRTATAFAKAGFDEKDYGDIVKKIVEVGGDKASELSDALIEFVKKANKSAVASAINGAVKDGAVPPKTSTAQASDTPYAGRAIAYTKHDDKSQEIKNRYK